MRRLIVGYSILVDPQFRVMYEEVERAIAAKEDVVFTWCNGRCHVCYKNPGASKFQCMLCRFWNWIYGKRFKNRVSFVFPRERKSHVRAFEYQNLLEIKSIVYRGVNIGYGVMSLYITWTRDLCEDISPQKRSYIDYLLQQACDCVDAAYEVVEASNPDCISVYNGRLLEMRPYFEIAKLKNIPVRVVEVVNGGADGACYKTFYFENGLPQDIELNGRLIQKLWELQDEMLEGKINVAESFFKNRRLGKPTADTLNPTQNTSFISGQKADELPGGLDKTKRNVVIFNSSEDEYASISKDFDAYSLYESQEVGIRSLLGILSDHPEFHVYLRIHPNLSKIKFPYHLKLYDLAREFKNLTVIPAKDPCSTYSLMSLAEKVIVFGSTMGAEATYWGKPVIQIGSSLYSTLDLAYRPKSTEELKSLLLCESLQPKRKIEALKYGYYLCRRDVLGEDAHYIDLGFCKYKFLGRERCAPAWPKMVGSFFLSAQIRDFVFRHLKYFSAVEIPERIVV